MEALVHLGRMRSENARISTITSTENKPLIAMDLSDDGSVEFRQLDVGSTVRGYPQISRTGTVSRPRPFRDQEKYTLTPGKYRDNYRKIIEAMAKAHPKAKGLRAFALALAKNHKKPAWVDDLIEKSKGGSEFVPFYKKKAVFELIAPDLVDGDPYIQEEYGRQQIDVVTGQPCRVPKNRAIRVSHLGEGSGTTLMSVDDDTTITMGLSLKSKENRYLRVPISESTMAFHVIGLQWLVDEGLSVQICGPRGSEGSIRYFMWMKSGEESVDKLLYNILRGNSSSEETQAAAHQMASVEDTLFVLGIREGKRIQYVGWHCVPAQEALSNIMAYAQRYCRNNENVILGINDIKRACAPFQLGLTGENSYNFETHNKAGEERCGSTTLVSIIDHIVEGLPFPYHITQQVRFSYASQQDTDLTGGYLHLQNQEALLE